METQSESCIRSCERLVIASYSLMDLGRYEACAELFTEDGVWVRGGKPVVGRSAILSALHGRSADHVTRHLITNVIATQTGEHAAEATAVFVPLRGPLGPNGLAPPPQVDTVGDLVYRFALREGRWLISHLEPRPLFRG